MQKSYGYLKPACYLVNITMSIVGNLPALLFLTFRSLYGISYSLLGLLVFISFFTQLAVDLIFSFFSHKFNISKTVKLTPVIAVIGLLFYGLWPFFFPENVYSGLVIGTLIFASSSGLAEVLISPVIAAIPAKDPDREMSKLHSVYAWGVVAVIIIATIFILTFGSENWQYLVFVCALVPLASAILFAKSTVPEMKTPDKVSGAISQLKNKSLWLCVIAIFLGGSAECSMAQWASGYLEQALGIPKVWGDIFGVAMFSVMLGLGRSLYAKIGKNIGKVLFFGAVGATLCYFISAVTSYALIGLFACAFTGFCVSMMWPGSLIVSSDHFPEGGVFIFAMMAAGGDMGAAIGPQLIGSITDFALKSDTLLNMAHTLAISPEQFGMKLGMLVGMLFPLLAIPVYLKIWRGNKK